MILSGQVSAPPSDDGKVCVIFESNDSLSKGVFYDEEGNTLNYKGENYIRKNSYIYLYIYNNTTADPKILAEWDSWMSPIMMNRPFKFKITKDVIIPATLLTEWNKFTEESGIISYDLFEDDIIAETGLPVLNTTCTSRVIFPNSGKPYTLSTESNAILKNIKKEVIVAIVGGTNTELNNSLLDLVPAIKQGLRAYNRSSYFCIINRANKEIWTALSESTSTGLVCVIMSDQEVSYPSEYNNISTILVYHPYTEYQDISKITYIKNYDNAPPAEYGAHIAELINYCIENSAVGQELYTKKLNSIS